MAETVNSLSRAAGHAAAERFLKRLYPETSSSIRARTSEVDPQPSRAEKSETRTVPLSIRIEKTRRAASKQLDPDRRTSFGQFMTPEITASFMASMFRTWPSDVQLLEPGAGMGSLVHAFANEFFRRNPGGSLKVTAYEIEPLLADYLCDHLETLSRAYRGLQHEIRRRDFIREATFATTFGAAGFTHVIMNPPYRKIGSKSEYRKALQQTIDVTAGNLYTAFLALAVELTATLGEIVAIVPRSFCNGTYFRPFRRWLLNRVAIKQIHVFESRRMAFRDDDVLQENIIVRLEKGGKQDSVLLSSSGGATFDDYRERVVPFEDVVRTSDPERFIHIPTFVLNESSSLFAYTLGELGLDVATGPVVDFRLREHSVAEPVEGTVPLLYAHHFFGGQLQWPKQHKKPNALRLNESTRKWLMPQGWYTLTRRFSAKEEKRRIVSYVVDPRELPFEVYGFENHLNVIHSRKRGISPELARGIALFLNSTIVDQHFRNFSGHTQVNATDLRTMKFPKKPTLIRFGEWAGKQNTLDQQKIDDFVGSS